MTDHSLDTGTVVLGMHVDAEVAHLVAKVIAGYSLTRRIGAGGYGEVWQAVGPGGLHKAVKILHGRHDGRQADVELRSLEKMKAVRHPFLLNIERIEVSDSRLIIVTELAECSLEDRFNDLRQDGERGIPREELLGYLRDASDALDFLYEQHGLQHLDVKPANLLIQGNHIKLADFGLIKEVDRTSESMVSGFTPLYAPPELFQGRPTRNSDQYSLAVVYQVMLTGQAPFGGRNAAQLVAQHLNSPPDLSGLSMTDRPAVARALSKNPRARFDTCRQFVDSLAERQSFKQPAAAARSSVSRPDATSGPRHSVPATRKNPQKASVPLPPLAPSAAPLLLRPTLFLGIGGRGGQVLSQVKEKLQLAGGIESPAAFPLLYLDSDPGSLRAVGAGQFGSPLRDDEALPMPLRSALEYREHFSGRVEWLSRRWLYNIPKSGLVDGIRPLGRLAFVEHCPAIRARLRQLLQQATTTESLASARQRFGADQVEQEPAVFVVASLAGGTGGGSVLDMAYLVRDVLSEMGLQHPRLFGILLQPTEPTFARQDVATANTLSCLSELRHYAAAGGFPGDQVCGLPANPSAPFDHVYLVGKNSGNDESAEVNRAVAEYLSRQVASREQSFFERHRRDGEDPAGMSWRTFSLVHGKRRDDEDLSEAVDLVQRALLRRWMTDNQTANRPVANGESPLSRWVKRLLQHLRIDTDQFVAQVAGRVSGEGGRRIANYVGQVLNRQDESSATAEQILQNCDAELAADPPSGSDEHPAAVLKSIYAECNALASTASAAIVNEVSAMFDLPGARFCMTREAFATVVASLDQIQSGIQSIVEGIDRDRRELRARLPGGSGGADSADNRGVTLASVCQKYYVLSICSQVYRHWLANLQGIREATTAAMSKLAVAGRHLRDQERSTLARIAASNSPGNLLPAGQAEVLARLVDEQLPARGEAHLLARLGEDSKTPGVWESLRRVIREVLQAQRVKQELDQWKHDQPGSVNSSSQPGLSSPWRFVGGQHRVLAVIPDEAAAAKLRSDLTQQFGDCVTVEQRAGEWLLCYEARDLDAGLVIDQLSGGNSEILDAARRLHTRTDVAWPRIV